MRRAAWRTGVWRSGLAVAVIMLLVACSDDDPPTRTAPSIPEATAAPSTTNPDPYAIPPVIDEAYINRVLAALDAAYGDAIRSSIREGAMTEESLQILDAIYTGESLRERVNLLQGDAEKGFRDYRTNPGSVETTVARMISSTPDCSFMNVRRNYQGVATNPPPPDTDQYVGLRKRRSEDGGDGHNPTPWIIVYDGFLESGSQPPNPCTASS